MKAKRLIKMLEQEDYADSDNPGELIKKDYNVDDNGIIRDPGKFEGEMYYVPYYYDLSMNGFSSESGGDVDAGGAWDFFELDVRIIKNSQNWKEKREYFFRIILKDLFLVNLLLNLLKMNMMTKMNMMMRMGMKKKGSQRNQRKEVNHER